MKDTAHVLFCVTKWPTSGKARNRGSQQGCDAHNRGVMFITGVVTLVTRQVTLVTRLYMRKMAVRLLDRTLRASWTQGG